MATAPVDIVNLALSNLGEDLIEDMEGTGKAEETANANYADLRDEVLARADWPCARIRRTLTSLAAAPVHTYGYQFAFPTNPYCLVPRKIEGVDRDAWFIEGDRKIVTSISTSINLVYTARITQEARMSPLFVAAFAARLAVALAMPVSGSKDKQRTQFGLYERLVSQAIARALSTNRSKPTAIADVRM